MIWLLWVSVFFLLISSMVFGQLQQLPLELGEGEISPDELLLKDYQPQYQLIVPETKVTQAKYPVIDVHMHYRPGRNPAEWAKLMEQMNVNMTWILNNSVGEEFQELYDIYVKPHPGKFIIFTGLGKSEWWSLPDYSDIAVQALQKVYDKGARGVGEILDHGQGLFDIYSERDTKIWPGVQKGIRDSKGHRIDFDHPMFDPVWEKCGELGIPVNVHIYTFPAFYAPWDRFNEQILTAVKGGTADGGLYHTDTHLSWEVMKQKRSAVLARHPNTIFIGAHLGMSSHNLAELGEILDAHPNFYVDLSATLHDLGRQPHFARKFFIKYQDRILFGTDLSPVPEKYLPAFRQLETDDDFFIPSCGGVRHWRAHGMHLPDEVLQKIYFSNAERLIPGIR